MPPSREQHERKFGDNILGDYVEDDDKGPSQSNLNDEEPPKPTADVLMSRNLRGGAGKGFAFDFCDDDDDDDDEKDFEGRKGADNSDDDDNSNNEDDIRPQNLLM